MAQISDYNLPEDLYYHKEHMWLKVEGDSVIVGGTDFMQKLAGTVKRIVTLEEDDEVEQDKPFGTVSTGKWTGKLYSPISGEITEVNEEVDSNPKLINDDPYGEGWLMKVSPSNLDEELGNLMKKGTADFETWLNAEIAKHVK